MSFKSTFFVVLVLFILSLFLFKDYTAPILKIFLKLATATLKLIIKLADVLLKKTRDFYFKSTQSLLDLVSKSKDFTTFKLHNSNFEDNKLIIYYHYNLDVQYKEFFLILWMSVNKDFDKILSPPADGGMVEKKNSNSCGV